MHLHHYALSSTLIVKEGEILCLSYSTPFLSLSLYIPLSSSRCPSFPSSSIFQSSSFYFVSINNLWFSRLWVWTQLPLCLQISLVRCFEILVQVEVDLSVCVCLHWEETPRKAAALQPTATFTTYEFKKKKQIKKRKRKSEKCGFPIQYPLKKKKKGLICVLQQRRSSTCACERVGVCARYTIQKPGDGQQGKPTTYSRNTSLFCAGPLCGIESNWSLVSCPKVSESA